MLHLKTFGGLSVEIDGTPGTGAAQQRKTLGLLALLAASGERGLSRDKLIASLWPETDAEHGRGLLRQACYALRRDLHAPELFLGSIQLHLNPAMISSDVESFACALGENDPGRAVSCYTAPFLDGFYLNGGGEFEDWAETERARLASQCRAALRVLSAEATRRGEHRVAADWWRRLLELDPLNTHAALGLMTALDNAGERAEALRCGQAYGELVRSELSTDPPPELSEWMEQHRHVHGNGVAGNGPSNQPLTMMARVVVGKGAISGVQDVPGGLIRRVRRAQLLSLTAVGAVVLLLAGAGYTVWKRHTMTAAQPVAASGRKMLVVLPFENRGPAADDYFADGLTEAIGMRLGGVRGLGVIAWQSARQYKGTNKSLAQIGRELGVEYVLQGSVRWEKTADSSRVRVSPTLIRVSDATQLWAAQYDTVLAGMFALQTSLATQVVGALDVALGYTERRILETGPTANLQAYDAFLGGVEAAEDGPSGPAAMRNVVRLFERAVALDSTFAIAYAYLSAAHVIMYLSYLDRDVDQLRRGKAAAVRAMHLDPECDSGSCCATGFYELFVLGNYDRALKEFTRARRAHPNDHNLLSLIAHAYGRQGQWNMALAYEREAERLNPLDGGQAASLGGLYAALRQFAAANYYFDRALALGPRSVTAHLTKALAYLNLTGDLEGARRFLPDVSENISPTGTQDVIISLSDIALLLSDEQQTRLLQLTPAAVDGDTAALALAKALVHQRRNHRALARASFDSARVVLQGKVRRHPDDDPFYHAMLGLALAGLEDGKDAVREGERAVALLPNPTGGAESTLLPANLARIHVLLGDREKAIDLLAVVFSGPGPLSAAWLRVDPFWDPLRSSPRFQQLAAAGIRP
jgi:TolB-like protein/DNA-binding SARP family transcriptional activator/Flp pilus assembly protein TadD